MKSFNEIEEPGSQRNGCLHPPLLIHMDRVDRQYYIDLFNHMDFVNFVMNRVLLIFVTTITTNNTVTINFKLQTGDTFGSR